MSTYKQLDKDWDVHLHIHMGTEDKHTQAHVCAQTGRQTDMWVDRQTYSQTDTHTKNNMHKHSLCLGSYCDYIKEIWKVAIYSPEIPILMNV